MKEFQFFLFIFTLLIVIRVIFKFLNSLLSTPPKPLTIGSRELTIIGLSIAYIITFIFKL
jgi:hypothetical protein